PTYDYVCKKCGHEFEFFQSMKDDRLTDCPLEECDGEVKRLLGTGAGIIFKGAGFYETDYRSDSYKKAEKADASKPETASSGDSSSSKKTEKSSSTSSSSTKSTSSSSGTST
ncbi:MAG: FmdB family zinc ribbon protein, partial [Verrucomicrobiota bacterium]